MEFKELNLHPDLQRGIDEAGYVSCMPVQEKVLSQAFGGQDLYVQSQTGTGKTAAFLVVIFQRLLSEEGLAGKKALIMAPTRELAVQIEEEAQMLGKYLPFKMGSFYGGVGYSQQRQLLRGDVQILTGTPGRILDLNKSGEMNLMNIGFLVLDEADRMFDMGFYPDLRKLIKVVPPADRRQTMLFSATLNAWVKNLAWEYTKNPAEIEIEPEVVTVDEVTQILYHVPSEEKMRLLLGILQREFADDESKSAIIFCNTKRYTEIVAKRLKINGFDCEFITGDMQQIKRLKVIEDLKAGQIKLLAATDVAARGIDINNLSMVINFDLPDAAENYVHRIGRTARAGKSGKSFTLVSEHDVYELPAIERYIGKKIDSEVAEEALYVEDKSAGFTIRSEFFEERYPPPAGRGGGQGRSSGRRRESERPRPPRGAFPKEDSRRRPPAGKSGGRPEGRGGRRGDSGEPSLKPNMRLSTEASDLSHLSLEERMAFYKAKYAEGPKAEKPAADVSQRGVPREDGRREEGRTDGRRRRRRGRGGSRGGAAGSRVQGEGRGASPARPPHERASRDGDRAHERAHRDGERAHERGSHGRGRDRPHREGAHERGHRDGERAHERALREGGGRDRPPRDRGRQDRGSQGRGRDGGRAKSPPAESQGAPSAPAQKGFFSKVLGLFRKKEDS
ncbi:MAG: DEAD/DEAH box helicase [Spirochaetes bacterium]|nr:DEAD/DEAH box helicase [Spirochaetota bacterium]